MVPAYLGRVSGHRDVSSGSPVIVMEGSRLRTLGTEAQRDRDAERRPCVGPFPGARSTRYPAQIQSVTYDRAGEDLWRILRTRGEGSAEPSTR